MKARRIHRSGALHGHLGIVMFGVAAFALVLGATGVHARLVPGSSTSPRTRPVPSVSINPAWSGAPAAVRHPVQQVTTKPSPTVQPTPDPIALADGVYPTYVRAVDVAGATVTVDVLQTFFGAAARQAAIEDGVAWKDVRYDPVYIRNENPLLRMLPVARDVHIKLIGVCMAPDRWIGLTQLRKATTPFTDTFYYDVRVVSGSVERIRQLVAIAGC